MTTRTATASTIPLSELRIPRRLAEQLLAELAVGPMSDAEHKLSYRVWHDDGLDAAALVAVAPDGRTRWRLDFVRATRLSSPVAEITLWHDYGDVSYVLTTTELDAVKRFNLATGGSLWHALRRWEPDLVNGSLITILHPHDDDRPRATLVA